MIERIIIQARMSSSRLPGKALFPIKGWASAVLCAKRASNTGLEVVVATSTDPSDDSLVRELKVHQIAVFRGSLTDVLSRYVGASSDLGPEDYIIRLTADNVFPDGKFVGELLGAVQKKRCDYLTTVYIGSLLPYGMSGEAFTVRALRRAAESSTSSDDREHVTPWLKRNFSDHEFSPKDWREKAGHLRCTLDNLSDYFLLWSLFESIEDPLHISSYELCRRLMNHPVSIARRVPVRLKGSILQSEMTLGAAQLGMDYGIVNEKGRPSVEESTRIVREAIEKGILQIDCARGYQDAETRVGLALEGGLKDKVKVITKLDPLPSLSDDAHSDEIKLAVDTSIFRSCRELRVQSLSVVLLHRSRHRVSHGGRIWKRLLELCREQVIGQLGVSVYTVEEALQALQDSQVQYLQIPFNLLDWRWKTGEFEKGIRQRPDVNVYARSIFLQGLLVSEKPVPREWVGEDVDTWRRKVDNLVTRLGRQSRMDLCVAYVRAHDWIDSLVLGVDSLSQLRMNVELFEFPPLKKEERESVEDELGNAPENLINPLLWSKNKSFV